MGAMAMTCGALGLCVPFACAQEGGAARPQAAASAAVPRYLPPYPFKADELWQRLRRVLGLPAESIEYHTVGRLLDVPDANWHLPSPGQTGEGAEWLGARSDWYFGVGLPFVDKRHQLHDFAIGFDDDWPPKKAPEGLCLQIADAKRDLLADGWEAPLVSHVSPHVSPTSPRVVLRLRRADASLLIFYFAPSREDDEHGCIADIRLTNAPPR
jgi:hypothetical protein